MVCFCIAANRLVFTSPIRSSCADCTKCRGKPQPHGKSAPRIAPASRLGLRPRGICAPQMQSPLLYQCYCINELRPFIPLGDIIINYRLKLAAFSLGPPMSINPIQHPAKFIQKSRPLSHHRHRYRLPNLSISRRPRTGTCDYHD